MLPRSSARIRISPTLICALFVANVNNRDFYDVQPEPIEEDFELKPDIT